jgi:hypothetical protein
MSRLKKEELKRKVTPVGDSESAETTRAFYAPQRGATTKSTERFTGKSDKVVECFKCGGPHFKRNCPQLKQNDDSRREDSSHDDSWREESWRGNSRTDSSRTKNLKEEKSRKDDSWRDDAGKRDSNKPHSFHSRMAFMGKSCHGVASNGLDWISDSGASQHICGNLALFSDYTPFLTERKVLMTDNRTIQVEGRGTVELEAYIQGRWEECTVNDVLYIPGAANLFSEGTMASKGFRIVRDSRTTTFQRRDGRGPVADFNGGVYVMRFRPIKQVQGGFLTRVEQPVQERQDNQFPRSLKLVGKVQMEKGTQTVIDEELSGRVEPLEQEPIETDDWFDALEPEEWFDAVEDVELSAVMVDGELSDVTDDQWSDAVESWDEVLTTGWSILDMQRTAVVICTFIFWSLIDFARMFQHCSVKVGEQLVDIGRNLAVELRRIEVETRQKEIGGGSQQLFIATHRVPVDPGPSFSQLPSTSKMKGKLEVPKRRLRISSG